MPWHTRSERNFVSSFMKLPTFQLVSLVKYFLWTSSTKMWMIHQSCLSDTHTYLNSALPYSCQLSLPQVLFFVKDHFMPTLIKLYSAFMGCNAFLFPTNFQSFGNHLQQWWGEKRSHFKTPANNKKLAAEQLIQVKLSCIGQFMLVHAAL